MIEHVATLTEIDDHWSIEDVLDAGEALDVFDDAQDPDRVPHDHDGASGDTLGIVISYGGKP